MSIYQNIELYKELLFRANEMLLKPTRAEKALKEAILDRFPTSDFQFQVVMVPFIVDVVSIESKLIIASTESFIHCDKLLNLSLIYYPA